VVERTQTVEMPKQVPPQHNSYSRGRGSDYLAYDPPGIENSQYKPFWVNFILTILISIWIYRLQSDTISTNIQSN
jgi:hypothetical protein